MWWLRKGREGIVGHRKGIDGKKKILILYNKKNEIREKERHRWEVKERDNKRR